MPVIATPIPQAPSITGQPSCAVQLAVAPKVTYLEGKPVLAKMQAVRIVQGQLATLNWTMRDASGNTVDLTACLDGTVQLKVMESLSLSSTNPGTVVAGSIVNAATGQVQALIPETLFEFPGISIAEFGLFDMAGHLNFSNTFYLIVDRGNFALITTMNGPLTIPEIRLHLRDSDPNQNLWLGDFEFDLPELAACIVRPIMEFNEAPPPLNQQWTTSNFPWRHNWLSATCGYLYRMAADWYRRVTLAYQAGGLSIDDKNKWREYDQRGAELLQEWRKWTQMKKVQINCEGAYSSVLSGYSSIGYW